MRGWLVTCQIFSNSWLESEYEANEEFEDRKRRAARGKLDPAKVRMFHVTLKVVR